MGVPMGALIGYDGGMAETFEDELDAHIAESMKDPAYRLASDRSELTEMLAQHEYDSGNFFSTHPGQCACGEEMPREQHRAHVAERQASLIDAARRAAWDEGYEDGYGDRLFEERAISTDPDYPHGNPYRAAEGT